MKKALALILALVMVLSLCACGGENKDLVEQQLQGTWILDGGGGVAGSIFDFKDGRFTHTGFMFGKKSGDASGVYKVKNKVIAYKYDGKSDWHDELEYKLKEGTLYLYYGAEHTPLKRY